MRTCRDLDRLYDDQSPSSQRPTKENIMTIDKNICGPNQAAKPEVAELNDRVSVLRENSKRRPNGFDQMVVLRCHAHSRVRVH